MLTSLYLCRLCMGRTSRKPGMQTTGSSVSSTGQPTCERINFSSDPAKGAITSALWGSMKDAVFARALHPKDHPEYVTRRDALETELHAWHLDQCEDLRTELEECQKQLQLEKAARADAESRLQQLDEQSKQPVTTQMQLQQLVMCLSAVVAESAAVSSTSKLMVKLYREALREAVGPDVMTSVEPLLVELIVQDPDLKAIKDALEQAGSGNLQQLWEATRSALTQLSQEDTVDASVRAVAELLASRKADYCSTQYTQAPIAQAAFSGASQQSARDLDWLLYEEAYRVFDSELTTLVNRDQFRKVKQLVGSRSVQPGEFKRLQQATETVDQLHKDLVQLAKRLHRPGREAQSSSRGRSPDDGDGRSKRVRS